LFVVCIAFWGGGGRVEDVGFGGRRYRCEPGDVPALSTGVTREDGDERDSGVFEYEFGAKRRGRVVK